MKIVTKSISKKELQQLAEERFGDMVKCVVDIEKNIMVAGWSLHADAESLLIENGSEQLHLWGINIYIPFEWKESIEFDSMINIRPWQGNRTRSVEDKKIQKKIIEYILKTIK